MAQPYADPLSRIRTARRRPRCPTPAARARASTTRRYEHDACGVAFVADLHGRRSHDVVANGPGRAVPAGPPRRARRRAEHRRRRRHHDPDPGRVPPRGGRLRAAAGRAVRHRPGLPARRRRRRGRARRPVLEKYALVEGAEVLGWRDVPVDPSGLGDDRPGGDARASGRCSSPRAGSPTRRRTAGAAGRSRAGPGGLLRAQADRAGDPRARRAGCTSRRCPAAPSSTRACSRPTSCRRSSRT